MGRIKHRPVNRYFAALGKRGGMATKRKHGGPGRPSGYYKRIGQKGGKRNLARHGGKP